MSVEQIARDFITRMNDVNAAEVVPDPGCRGGRWRAATAHPGQGSHQYFDRIEDSFPRLEI